MLGGHQFLHIFANGFLAALSRPSATVWLSFWRPLATLWLPLASIWRAFGSLSITFGSLQLTFLFFWLPFRSTFAHPTTLSIRSGVLLVHFRPSWREMAPNLEPICRPSGAERVKTLIADWCDLWEHSGKFP